MNFWAEYDQLTEMWANSVVSILPLFWCNRAVKSFCAGSVKHLRGLASVWAGPSFARPQWPQLGGNAITKGQPPTSTHLWASGPQPLGWFPHRYFSFYPSNCACRAVKWILWHPTRRVIKLFHRHCFIQQSQAASYLGKMHLPMSSLCRRGLGTYRVPQWQYPLSWPIGRDNIHYFQQGKKGYYHPSE